MNRRTAVVLGVLALAACAPTPQTRAPTPPVPSGLEAFYSQQATWTDCRPFATSELDREIFANPALECARVEVPLDYADPAGRRASLGVLRLPASGGAQERIGSLLVNPGGPGASGMNLAAQFAAGPPPPEAADLPRRFDLVGFDPRGIGASTPAVECRTDAELDAERLDLDVDTSAAGDAQTEAEARALAQLCAERVGVDVLANVGSRDVARDLDVLRAVLGDEKLTYLGYSYGTQFGTDYAEQFPGNVRALVLDGAIDPTQDPTELDVFQAAAFQKAFDAYVDSCVRRPGCWLGQTPRDQANSAFQALLRPLTEAPLPVGGRVLSYTDAVAGTISALYSEQQWEMLDAGLTGLAAGDGSVLLQLADSLLQRDALGYTNLADAYTAVLCVDFEPVDDPVAVRETNRRSQEAAPFLDDGRDPSAARDQCAFWPAGPTGEVGAPQVDGLSQVLVVSTTGDPATPYENGVNLARVLGARLLTFEGQQHTASLQGVPCMDQAVRDYLVDLTLPPEGTRCSA